MLLTANDPIPLRNKDGSVFCEPAILRVDLAQHVRESAPRVLLEEEHSPTYSLTPSEAIEIGRALVMAGEVGPKH